MTLVQNRFFALLMNPSGCTNVSKFTTNINIEQ